MVAFHRQLPYGYQVLDDTDTPIFRQRNKISNSDFRDLRAGPIKKNLDLLEKRNYLVSEFAIGTLSYLPFFRPCHQD